MNGRLREVHQILQLDERSLNINYVRTVKPLVLTAQSSPWGNLTGTLPQPLGQNPSIIYPSISQRLVNREPSTRCCRPPCQLNSFIFWYHVLYYCKNLPEP
jgi:hypothetical protein